MSTATGSGASWRFCAEDESSEPETLLARLRNPDPRMPIVIRQRCKSGTLADVELSGNRLEIDGDSCEVGRETEYPALYERFANLIRAGESEVDLAPLKLAEDALRHGRIAAVERFEEFA